MIRCPPKVSQWAERAAYKCFWAVVALASFDLLSTWAGVCMLGGVELNPVAVYVVQAMGYAPFAVVFLTAYSAGAWYAYRNIARNTNGNMRLVCLALLLGAVLIYAYSMFSNLEQLVSMVSGVQVETRIVADGTVPLDRVYAAIQAFDGSKFCSVWGPFS